MVQLKKTGDCSEVKDLAKAAGHVQAFDLLNFPLTPVYLTNLD